ncbi:META domain-containing protein [Kribbella sp. NPDC000426]|uniref:META domain-containing protein n=1 Tax=Kribbella sp. NPDC000426 TaxID=3154255 RepID=UPI00331BD2F0
MTIEYGPLIGGEGSPIGKTYLSVAVTEDGVDRPLVPGSRISLTIRKDGVLIVRAGCNQLGGGVTLDDGVLGFVEGVQTQIGCGPELEAQDDWLMEFVTRRPAWTIDGDTLTLNSGGTTIVLLDRRLAEPDLPLDGTDWTVQSILIDDDDLRWRYTLGDAATLTLNGTRATGSTGSSSFTATVIRDDRTLTLNDLVVAPTRPTGRAADLERAVLEILRTPLTYSIESNRLRLRGPTGITGFNLIAVRPEGDSEKAW